MPGFAHFLPRAAVVAGLLLTAGTSDLLAQERVGVNSAVNPEATGVLPGAAPRRLVIGQDVIFNERITTAAAGQTQLLFLDESSMSIGPNSDLTIDQFVYDPKTGTGKLAMSATRGLLRYVGGKLSKQNEAVTLRTATATLAVRGGAFIVEIGPGGRTDATFLYGKGLTVIGLAGGIQTVTRPGFMITVSGPGAAPSQPAPAPPGALALATQTLDGQPGGSGGASVIPTDTTVADSGVSQTISGNFAQSVQQAAQNQATTTTLQPNPTNPTPVPASITSTLQSTTTQSATTQSATNGSTSPPPVTITFAGRVKSTNGQGTARGFIDQTANGDRAYSGGTLTGGVFTATVGNNLGAISFPLASGSSSFGPTGTSSGLGSFTGTSFLSADNTFFYANITPTSQPAQRLFIFGGVPVNAGFYPATGSTRVFAFNVQPDAALQSGIPFIRNQAGGNLSNPTVSPYYVYAPATGQFAATSSRSLQASLAVNGQGASQSSVLVINTGNVFTAADSGKPAGDNISRGSFSASGSSPLVRIGGNASTSPDGAGNTFFGGNNISGFVLDQGLYDINGNRQTATSSEITYGGPTTSYGFAQPVTPTALPANVGSSRTSQTLTGNFGGIMYPLVGSSPGSPYSVTGTTSITTNAPNGNLTSTFSGSDPFGTNTVVLQFGFTPNGTNTRTNSAFIDDNNFAAVENQSTASQVNGTNIQLNGDPTQASSIALVSSGVVPTSSLLPNGLCSSCQFLQWGYWTGQLDTPDITGTAVTRSDRAHINTWVAGIPTSVTDINTLMGTAFVGNYTGNALGSVVNNGSSYLASGGFNGTYNFGTQTGTVTISNFDGRTISTSGSAPLSGGNYTFTVAQPGVAGSLNGTFYGPAAAETGGNFAIRATAGPSYLASGIFAGKR